MQYETRDSAILAAIIEQYISTGEPVPSLVVSQLSALSLSPASIRSAMAELTARGFLEQPHVSAGRVPTTKAFKRYVDTLMRPHVLQESAKQSITEALDAGTPEVGHLLRRASTIVSSNCFQLGVVVAPKGDGARWRGIEFAKTGHHLVLAVLILDGGLVRTRMVETAEEYSGDELVHFGNYLNSHFKGYTLHEVRQCILAELQGAGEHIEELRQRAFALSCAAVTSEGDERELFVDGASQVVHQAEFADAKRLRELLSLLEERSRLLALLDQTIQGREISISFYREADDSAPWAVVSAPYAASESGDSPHGVVSAVGPMRMDYAAVLPVVAHIARTVAGILHRRFDIS